MTEQAKLTPSQEVLERARGIARQTTYATPATSGPSIHERMAAILGELPAIGKNQENTGQGFMFRGIDDVLNELNPLLAKHGVYFVPDVVERIDEKRPASGNRINHAVHLHVRYRFYGLAGDYVEASGWGEGTDMGDKATNKAMTGAMKYVLFQTFAISTGEASDSDATPSEDTVARSEPPPEWFGLYERLKARFGEDNEAIKNFCIEAAGDSWPGLTASSEQQRDLVEKKLDEAVDVERGA